MMQCDAEIGPAQTEDSVPNDRPPKGVNYVSCFFPDLKKALTFYH